MTHRAIHRATRARIAQAEREAKESFSIVRVLSPDYVQELSHHATEDAATAAMRALGERSYGGDQHLIIRLEGDDWEACETCGRETSAKLLDEDGDCGLCGYRNAVLADGKEGGRDE